MTIYPRGRVYYVEFRLPDGTRIKKSTGVSVAESKRKAEEVAMLIYAEAKQGMNKKTKKDESRMLFSEAIEKAYQQKWSKNKDDVYPYRRARALLELLGKDCYLDEITSRVIADLQDKLFSRDITPATVNRYMAALKVILNMALKQWGVLQKLPYIPMYKEQRKKIRYLTKEEEDQLLTLTREAGREDIADMFAALLDTGFRFSEMANLTFDAIDFDQGVVHCWYNKSDRPRTVPLTKRAKVIFQKRREELAGDKPFPLTYDEVRWYFEKAKAEMGLLNDKDFTIHALRHTFASRLVQAGVPLYVVKQLLGHSSIQVTERYAHLADPNLRHAIATLDK